MSFLKKTLAVILSCAGTLVLFGTISGIGKLFSAPSTEALLGQLIGTMILLVLALLSFKIAGRLFKDKDKAVVPPPLPPVAATTDPQ